MSNDEAGELLMDALREAGKHCSSIVGDDEYTHLSLLDSRMIPRGKAVNLATSIKEDITAFDERKRAAEKNPFRAGNAPYIRPPPLFPQDQYIRQFITPGTENRLFITGEGGMGKTEYTRLITLRMAEAFLRQDSSAPLLPYRIELKSLGKDDVRRADGLHDRLADATTWRWLEALANGGRVAFILDGTDELSVADPKTFNSALPEFVRRYATCPFIFAGRPGTLPDGIPGLNPQKHTHILQPLTDEQIRQFAHDFFDAADRRALSARGNRGTAFVAELRSKQSTLYPVIRTPFMLGFAISHFAENDSVPNNPAELVEFGLTD